MGFEIVWLGFERRFEFGLSWVVRVLVDKNNKNLLVVVPRSSVAHVAVLCACECKRASILSLTNHQQPFRLWTTTRTINQKNIVPSIVSENDSHVVMLNIIGNITPSCKWSYFICLVRKIVFERSDGLSSFGCVNQEGVVMNGFGGW